MLVEGFGGFPAFDEGELTFGAFFCKGAEVVADVARFFAGCFDEFLGAGDEVVNVFRADGCCCADTDHGFSLERGVDTFLR